MTLSPFLKKSFENIFNHIDSVGQHLVSAQKRNFELWDVLDSYVWPNYQLGVTYQDELDFLKYWIYNRVIWIDNNISNFRMIFPDCSSSEKKLVQVVNQLGQKTAANKNKILFYIYDNGCVERNFITY